MATVRDKFWMFGVRAHQDDIWLGRDEKDRFTKWSRITAAEGAAMLGVPNMMMVTCDGIPAPFSQDALGYMESFRRMKQVLWSGAGSGPAGGPTTHEARFVAYLADRYPNVTGAFMDDFFGEFNRLPDGERSDRALSKLRSIREALDQASRPLELWIVWYTHEAELFRPDVFEPLTGVSLWTWDCQELPKLPERFEALEKAMPHKKKMLGIYMFDFPSGQPVPNSLMEYQCELGLQWLREGRLDGMIFETNSVMGVGLPSEKWLCDWIDRVGEIPLP